MSRVYHIKTQSIRINNEMVIKLLRAHSECLGTRSRRRTQQTAKRDGEWYVHKDPSISEWGNPAAVMSCHP